jgi:hypothetical protein
VFLTEEGPVGIPIKNILNLLSSHKIEMTLLCKILFEGFLEHIVNYVLISFKFNTDRYAILVSNLTSFHFLSLLAKLPGCMLGVDLTRKSRFILAWLKPGLKVQECACPTSSELLHLTRFTCPL